MPIGCLIALVLIAFVILLGLRVVKQYERLVVFRLGKLSGAREAGLTLLIPIIDRCVRVDTRIQTTTLETQEVITADNVPIEVNAVVLSKITDPILATTAVQDVDDATTTISLTSLRNVLGKHTFDEVLKDRDKLDDMMKQAISEVTSKFGLEVIACEIKSVQTPDSLKRILAQEAEAIREKRARIIKADGELEAAKTMSQAAELIAKNPAALELRRMQMMTEIGAEQNSTMVIMMPSDIVTGIGAIAKMVNPA